MSLKEYFRKVASPSPILWVLGLVPFPLLLESWTDQMSCRSCLNIHSAIACPYEDGIRPGSVRLFLKLISNKLIRLVCISGNNTCTYHVLDLVVRSQRSSASLFR